MSSEKQERPILRVAVILGSVSVLGLFLGWMLERQYGGPVYDDDEAPELPTIPTGALPQREGGPSAWESEVLKRATAGLPPYPNAEPHALGADWLGPNVPIAAAWFTTRDSPDQVLDFYKGQLYDAGIPGTESRPSESSGYVAYMVPLNGVIRSVTATRQGEETVVLVSNGNMAPLVEEKPNVPAELPHPPEAENTMALQMNQEGRDDVSVVATVEGTDLERWTQFYKQGFEAKGWKVQSVQSPSSDEVQVDAERQGFRATAYLRRLGAEQKIEILVRMSEA